MNEAYGVYNDLIEEITVLEIREDQITTQIDRILDHNRPATRLTASYSGMPGGGQLFVTDLIIESICQLKLKLADVQDVLSLKREARQRIEERLAQSQGLEQQIFVMRFVQRKKLEDIANELGYSYQYIKERSARIKKKPTETLLPA